MSSANPSFFKRAILWGATATFILSVAAAGIIFAWAYHEIREQQDDTLEEVAAVLARSEVARIEPRALWLDDDTFEDWYLVDDDSPKSVIPAGATVLVRSLHDGGKTLSITFDTQHRNGIDTLSLHGESHRVYFMTLTNGEHIAVAQATEEIQEIAAAGALSAVIPVLVMAITLFFVFTALLYLAMRPVKDLEATLKIRKSEDLSALDVTGLPAELVPLVKAFNGVLARIEDAQTRESRFVADAAHELRTPLTALTLQVEEMQKEPLSEATRKKLAALALSVNRASRLVSQLLSLKRAQIKNQTQSAKAPATAPLTATLAQAIEAVWPEAQKKAIELEAVNFDQLDPQQETKVEIAEDDLFAILRNLLENAVRYTPEHGRVVITLAALSPFTLTVADTGPGVAAKERDRVFDPFYRVLGSGVSGTGLGLAIVKTLCEQNGLSITLGDANLVEGVRGLAVTITQTTP